jgi:hypothetical protein
MGHVERLLQNYERYVSLPWDKNLAGAQKIWFVVYNKNEERRLRLRIPEFENLTIKAGHRWVSHDLTDAFAEWLSGQEYRESYFESPDLLGVALDGFKDFVAERVEPLLASADENTVISVYGVAGLFGFMKTSELLSRIETKIKGRLLVFFPGEYENKTYRLLDAREGWNYLAVPITAEESLVRS